MGFLRPLLTSNIFLIPAARVTNCSFTRTYLYDNTTSLTALMNMFQALMTNSATKLIRNCVVTRKVVAWLTVDLTVVRTRPKRKHIHTRERTKKWLLKKKKSQSLLVNFGIRTRALKTKRIQRLFVFILINFNLIVHPHPLLSQGCQFFQFQFKWICQVGCPYQVCSFLYLWNRETEGILPPPPSLLSPLPHTHTHRHIQTDC